jgi:hypothetical protein
MTWHNRGHFSKKAQGAVSSQAKSSARRDRGYAGAKDGLPEPDLVMFT